MRLNTPEYGKASFRAGDIAVADPAFQDCAAPPAHVVGKFRVVRDVRVVALAEGIPGALAVHWKAGLGRTCTLRVVALYMMKHHGFTAREAMGWLRILRPGRSLNRPSSGKLLFLLNHRDSAHATKN